jgi:phosphatidylserine/phosphatidylglycerophosphate/cardiolipin synthase-like enzyme
MTLRAYRAERALHIASREYPGFVLESIRRARVRFWANLFFVNPYPQDDVDGIVMNVLRQLRRARQTGLDVRVLVDGARNTEALNASSQLTHLLCWRFKLPCRYYAGPRRSNHTKGIVIDCDYVLFGSHNWSPGAFGRHVESSIWVEGRGLNSVLADRFLERWYRAGSKYRPDPGGA